MDPRLLLAVVITAFAAYATFSLIRTLKQLPVARRRPVPVLRARARGELARRSGVAAGRRPRSCSRSRAPRPVLGRVDGPARDRPGPSIDPPAAGVAGPGERVHAAVVRHRAHESEKILQDIASAEADVQASRERGVGRRVPQPDLPGAHDRAVHVLLRRRRAPVPSRRLLDAAPEAAARDPRGGNVAIDKTGGYLYSRLLLALVNAGATFVVLQALGPVRGPARPVAGLRLAVHPRRRHVHRGRRAAGRRAARRPWTRCSS